MRSRLPSAPAHSCPSGAQSNSQQQLTITVTKGSASSSITTVVADPISPNASGAPPCQYPASQLAWVQQPSTGPAGASLFPVPSVAVEDKTGCIVQSDASPVTLAITAGTGTAGATLNNSAASLNYGTTVFSGCSIAVPGTGYTLTASDPTDGLAAVQSGPFTITAGVPAQLVFTQEPGGGTGGTPWISANQPKVSVEDAQGHLVTTDQSTITLAMGNNPSNGTLSGCSSATTVNGVATFTGCTIDKAGSGYTLTATDAADSLNVPVASNAFNIAVGPPSQLTFAISPAGSVTGDPFGTQPVVAIEDAGGNVVTTATNAVTLAIGTNPGGGTLGGCSATTTSGLASFSGCTINQAGNGYTLAASATSLAGATSSPFNVSAAQLTSFQVSPATGTPTAGTPFNVTITALDQLGDRFSGFTGSQALTWSGTATASSPNDTAPTLPTPRPRFTNGAATASVTLTKAQNGAVLTVAQGTPSGSTTGFTVNGAATAKSFTLSTPSPTAGTAFNETVTALDTYGNTATGYGGTQTLTWSGTATASSPNNTAPTIPTSVSFSAGVATPSITLTKAATGLTLTATQGSATGSATFTVSPGNAASFTVPTPAPQTAGTSFSVGITALDATATRRRATAAPRPSPGAARRRPARPTTPLRPCRTRSPSRAARRRPQGSS